MGVKAEKRPRMKASDACIYEPDAVFVGVLLFGERVCSTCGDPLPANLDYFQSNKGHGGPLTYNCRRCRRKVTTAYNRKRRAK